MIRAAIVEQALLDYFNLLAGFQAPTAKCNVAECRQFFRSEWFSVLCDLDPEWLMTMIERKAKSMILKYEVHKETGSSQYYVTEAGCKGPVPGTYGTKRRALHTAAKLNGLSYKNYMKVRKRDGVSND